MPTLRVNNRLIHPPKVEFFQKSLDKKYIYIYIIYYIKSQSDILGGKLYVR